MVEICSLGGYVEIGRNMTAIKCNDSTAILDLGIHLDAYIRYTKDEDTLNLTYEKLVEIGAVASLDPIDSWRDTVRVLVPTHAHLDHIGAVPYMAGMFNAPMVCTPFTAEVIKSLLKDNEMKLDNKMIVINENATYRVDKNITIEFIHVTHSVPHTVIVAVHTPDGVICYGNDFKLDPFPVLGKASNLQRLKELGDEGVLALICDCTRAKEEGKTPSESVAREKLRDIMEGMDLTGKALVITTFSSHIARLKGILQFAERIGRKVVFVGRSLGRYSEAAEAIDLIKFSKVAKIAKYPEQVKKILRQVSEEGPENYVVIVTGHQGEPAAILSRLVHGELPLKLTAGDFVVFASQIIPTPTNLENRKNLDDDIKRLGVRIFNDIHVSGHGGREDLRELITLLRPKHIIPAHGFPAMRDALGKLAENVGYEVGKNVHMVKTGEIVKF